MYVVYLQPPGVMNVDVDEHPLELVEQLEWRDQAPGDPRNPFLRETTPFDWDIQGRGHPLRFPKDPYGTGSMTQDQYIPTEGRQDISKQESQSQQCQTRSNYQ